MNDALSPEVRALFASLAHAGDLLPGEGEVRLGEAGREADGTRVRFALRLQGDTLTEVRFRAYGCPHTLAVCEWLAGQVERQSLQALHRNKMPFGEPPQWADLLAVPPAKLGRLLVVEDALRAALTER